MKSRNKKQAGTKTSSGPRGGQKTLTGLETEIMQVVWERGTISAGEVREALLPERPLARTTILTVLEKLRAKKVVRVMPSIGREKKFRARIAKATVAGELLRDLRGLYFNDSAASLVAHLIREGDVGKRELEEIRGIIDRSKEGDES